MNVVATYWFLIAGALFIGVALLGTLLKRLPLSTAMLYFGIGVGLGPMGVNLLRVDIVEHAAVLERASEIAVIVSLFAAGLQLRAPVGDSIWGLPVRLATVSMIITIAIVAVVGHYILEWPLGAAILLGALLAPTDPVLASDVQVEHPDDRDRLRFALTGEAGLNDGAAFPFVLLGLGLLAHHPGYTKDPTLLASGLNALNFFDVKFGAFSWLAIDVVYKVAMGLLTGVALGNLVGRLVVYLRREHEEAVGTDDFLALGLIAGSYGVALALDSYAFLAVFTAGYTLRQIERRASIEAGDDDEAGELADDTPDDANANDNRENAENEVDPATRTRKAARELTRELLNFNAQLERVAELALVLVIGGLLSGILARGAMPQATWWFVPMLFLLVRPIAVAVGLWKSKSRRVQRRFIAWFGIRGVGSLYYLTYAIVHGLEEEYSRPLSGLVLASIAASIIAHGISVTPLMNLYSARFSKSKAEAEPAAA